MSGGNQNLVFNTRERLVSSDHNRTQAFAARERAEIWRMLQAVGRTTQLGTEQVYLEVGGYINTIVGASPSVGTPIIGDVFEGLVVLPQPGSRNLLVTPGIVGLVDPDGQTGSSDPSTPSSDDSVYKLVNDPGVLIAGALTIAAGAGSTRIDLVECRRQTVVLETDSRDVFDPSTGVFAPVTVSKVKAGRLIYRVTQGTPGGGIPPFSQGWLPLCVASVPSSATTVDQMQFWDVRPLTRDRVSPHGQGFKVFASMDTDYGLFGDDHTGTTCIVSGVARSSIGMYKAGGFILGLDARSAANQASGYAPTNNQPWYLYAVFPADLPRWVAYKNVLGAIIPSGPMGVITVSHIGPPNGAEPASTSINPPAATGLVTAGKAALLVASTYTSSHENGFVCANGVTRPTTGTTLSFSPTSSNFQQDWYDFTSNLKFPRGAKALIVQATTQYHMSSLGDSVSVNVNFQLLRSSVGTAIIDVKAFGLTACAPNALDVNITAVVEIPLIPYPIENGFTGDMNIMVDWGTNVGTRGSSSARIVGWRM